MPNLMKFAENVQGTLTSTPSSAKTAILSIDLQDLQDIAHSLEGEECISQVARFADFPGDDSTKELAIMATLRFYSNVRYLVERINEVVNKATKNQQNEN